MLLCQWLSHPWRTIKAISTTFGMRNLSAGKNMISSFTEMTSSLSGVRKTVGWVLSCIFCQMLYLRSWWMFVRGHKPFFLDVHYQNTYQSLSFSSLRHKQRVKTLMFTLTLTLALALLSKHSLPFSRHFSLLYQLFFCISSTSQEASGYVLSWYSWWRFPWRCLPWQTPRDTRFLLLQPRKYPFPAYFSWPRALADTETYTETYSYCAVLVVFLGSLPVEW